MTKKKLNQVKQEAIGIAFILPALIPLLIFVIYPIIRCFVLSFYSYNMTSTMKFVGWRNFQKLFSRKEIWDTIFNTLRYALIVLPVILLGGFALGVALSKKGKVNVVYRTLIFAPHVTSMVAISSVWLFVFHPQYGAVNMLLETFGMMPVRWLNEPATAFWVISFVNIWRMIGYDTIVFIGGIQNISTEVLEAATIDGASRWRTICHIIFPLTSPTTFMLMILNTIGILKMFTVINVLTGGGPAKSTQNLVIMLHDYAFNRFQVGYASAISTVLFLLILVIHIVQRTLERKVQYDQ